MENTKKILNILFWVIFIVFIAVWIFDFAMVKLNKDPKVCIRKAHYNFEDGYVNECLGLGYKVYYYSRDSIGKGYEFGPFFIKMRNKES